jgi:hypothetical protein
MLEGISRLSSGVLTMSGLWGKFKFDPVVDQGRLDGDPN